MSPLVQCTACLLFLSTWFLQLNAQAQVIAGGFGAPVGTYQYQGPRGEREFIQSIGGAKVGIYRRVQVPRLRARIPVLPPVVAPPVRRYPPAPRPPIRRRPPPPTKKTYTPPPKKPTGVGYRNGLLGGLLNGLLGGR